MTLPARATTLGAKLETIDAKHGGSLDVSAVGEALRDALALPRNERPYRVYVDGQHKGVEQVLAAAAKPIFSTSSFVRPHA